MLTNYFNKQINNDFNKIDNYQKFIKKIKNEILSKYILKQWNDKISDEYLLKLY